MPSERSSSRLRDWNTPRHAQASHARRVRTLIIPTEGLEQPATLVAQCRDLMSERSSSRLRDWNAAMKQRRNEHDESERSSSRLRDWNPASAGRGAPAQATSERSSSRLRDWNTSGVAFQMMYGPVRTL